MVVLNSSPAGRRIRGSRHLTDDQRACLAEEERRYLAAKNISEQRRVAGLARQSKASGLVTSTNPLTDASASKPKEPVNSRTQVAKQHRVSEHKLRALGKSTREIAKAVGVHHSTIADELNMSSVGNPTVYIPPPDKPKRLTRETKAAIAKALEGRQQIEAAECGEDVAELRCVTKAAVTEWKRASDVLGAIEGKIQLTVLEHFQPTHATEIARHFRKLAGKADGWDEETREQAK